MDASNVLANFRIVPVVVVNDPQQALKLAEHFLGADLGCIEITLRTPAALDCLEAVAKAFPEATPGAGSVTTPEQLRATANAGGQFAVSPGATPELLEAAVDFPLVPGGISATEVMTLKANGYRTVKFFPAELSGGLKAIRALCEPIPDVQFFPTGGISEANVSEYLEFDRIACVGGSWLAPAADVEQNRWAEIAERCAAAQRLLAG